MSLTVAGWLLIACMAGQFWLGYLFRKEVGEPLERAKDEHESRLRDVAGEEGVV